MTQFLTIDRADSVATVLFNQPDSRNAISTFEDCDEIATAFQSLDADRSVRCVILSANGPAFSAGGDLKKMHDGVGLASGRTSAEVRRSYHRGVRRIVTTLAALDVPLITAINGPAIGLGCDLAALGDIRIASDKAMFAMSFVKVGLVPGDGGSWILPRRIGSSHAMRMILSGAPVKPAEALAIGLVSEVVDADRLMSRALEIAREISRNPPEATRMAKRLIRASANTDLEGALDLAAAYQSILHKTADHAEAVASLIEKRQGRFTGD